jgi:hypothetical protein
MSGGDLILRYNKLTLHALVCQDHFLSQEYVYYKTPESKSCEVRTFL